MATFFQWLRRRNIRRMLRARRARRDQLASQFRKSVIHRCGRISVSLIAWQPSPMHAGPFYYYVWESSPRQKFILVLDRKTRGAAAIREAVRLAARELSA